MKYFLRRAVPPPSRVLLVESGSRRILNQLLPGFYELHGEKMRVDLITCYPGEPDAFRGDRGQVYRTTAYPGTASRKALLRELRANRYAVAGIVCSAEPILAKWKWVLAARLPAKIFIVNENADYFWLDRGSWRILIQVAKVRTGLTGAGAARTLARLLLFPLAFAYLLLYAAIIHSRRRLRRA